MAPYYGKWVIFFRVKAYYQLTNRKDEMRWIKESIRFRPVGILNAM